MYQIELVWNREFHFVPFGDLKDDLESAKKYAKSLLNMGDGASVKKCQIVNAANGEIIVPSHKINF